MIFCFIPNSIATKRGNVTAIGVWNVCEYTNLGVLNVIGKIPFVQIHFQPQTTTKSTVAKCGGCIVQCPIEQYGPNPPKTTYHCCRCPPPPRTPPTPPPKGKCFPSTAKVSLENGKYVTMSELRTEDKVQTGIHLVYSLFHYFFKNIIF